MDFIKISDKIYAHPEDRERMEAMNNLYYDMAETIRNQNPELYRQYSEMAEDILCEITDSEAMDIVHAMRPNGERWTIQEVYSLLESKGIEPTIDYYLTMNMVYNDYKHVADKYGLDNVDFYFDLAQAFIDDADGVRHKVAKYFKMD